MPKALTDVAIRSARPAPKITKLSDGKGLQLWLMPGGSKLWRQSYRHSGKQKLLSHGEYPAVSLAMARAKCQAAKLLLADGVDPGEQKKLDRIAKATSDAETFAIVACELVAKKRREGRAPATLERTDFLLAKALPALGGRPVADITASEVLAVLRRVQASGLGHSARRLRGLIGEVFRFAIATARATNDPTFALRGALDVTAVQHRAAITDPKALGGLVRAIASFDGQPTTIAALKLMVLLFPRPGELRLAEWREVDLGNAVWTIPATRTKMRREHRVPLPAQALAVLADLQAYTGQGVLVFPGLRSVTRPISENTMNAALRRMGYAQDEMTAHGFRATASTLLNESGKFSADAIERALAHQDKDTVRRAYARGAHWDERCTMMQWWADHLDTLREGATVIAMPPALRAAHR